MNPSDIDPNRQDRNQNNTPSATTSGSELISYQPTQNPIDFTEFLNIEDDQSLLTSNQTGSCKTVK